MYIFKNNLYFYISYIYLYYTSKKFKNMKKITRTYEYSYNYTTVNISKDIFKLAKMYCVKNDLTIKKFVEAAIKKSLDNK